jgi:hypothetical protein
VLVAVAVVAIGAGVYALEQGGGAKHSVARHHIARPTVTAAPVVPAGPPTVPVAVLNAGNTAGAAGDMAQQLHSLGLTIGTIGDLSESVSSSLEIAYAPGAQMQAERLAKLLTSKSPSVTPMDSATQAAAGSGAELAVVIG